MFDGGAINESELEKSRSSFEQGQNAFEEAKSRLKNSSNESNIYIQRKNIEMAKIELELLEKNLEKTTIRSSIDRTITEVMLQSGESFERKDYMFNIQNFTKNQIVADISEADINKVK